MAEGVGALVFSASEAHVAAGGVYELPIPSDQLRGSFLIYRYSERTGNGIRFTITTDGPLPLVDEMQVESRDQLLLSGEMCTLRWDNTDSWLSPRLISYSVKVVSPSELQAKMARKLLYAAEHGPPADLHECLGRGVSLETTNSQGHTPLMRSALSCDGGERTDILLKARASPYACDANGNSAAHLCAVGGCRGTLETLLEAGARQDATNADGATPLHLAALGGKFEAVDLLLSSGAAAGVADTRGNMPLHLAAAAGHAQCVRRNALA